MQDKLQVLLLADLKGLDKGLNQASANVDKFSQRVNKNAKRSSETVEQTLGKTFQKLGPLIAGAFSAQVIKSFTTEAVQMAATLEGVEAAFNRIDDGGRLDELRKATRGTVADLKLMQLAVQANNFQIPLNQLASLFDFARRRAKETGESVDFLVNSIVLGIGRKSPLILDNLGISAVRLRQELKGVGVEAASVGDIAKIVGDIATKEMEKMGSESVTTADKIQQVQASYKNLKTTVGEGLINLFAGGSGGENKLARFLDVLSATISGDGAQTARWGDFLNDAELAAFEKGLADQTAFLSNPKRLEALTNGIGGTAKAIAMLNVQSRKWRQKAETLQNSNNVLANTFFGMAKANEEFAKQLAKTGKAAGETGEDLDELEKKILAKANATIEENKLLREQTRIEKELFEIRQKGLQMFQGDQKNPFQDQADQLKKIFEGSTPKLARPNMGAVIGQMTEQTEQRLQRTNAELALMNELGGSMAMVFTDAFSAMADEGANFDEILRKLIKDILLAITRLLIFRGLMAALTGGASIPVGATVPNLALRGFQNLQPFAKGGIVSGPTQALIGEYSGARSNPEVVAPLNRLKSMLGNMGGSQNIRVTGVIRGDDFYQQGQASKQRNTRWRNGRG